MNALRSALTALSLLLLALGYAASQWAFFSGEPSGRPDRLAAHAARMEMPAVRYLCLALLALAVVLALIPDRDEARGES